MKGVERSQAGLASGLVNTTAQVGAALGLAVLATVSASHSDNLIADGESTAQALTSGYHLAFWIGAALVLAAIVVALTVLQPDEATAQEHGAEHGEAAARSRTPKPHNREPWIPRSGFAGWSSGSARSPLLTASTSTCPSGKCVGLLGPNGAGKSTTMKALTAQVICDEGELEVLGHRLPDDSKQARAVMGVVPQLDNLDVSLTVEQNLIVFSHLYRVPADRAQGRDRARAGDREPDRPPRLEGGPAERRHAAAAADHPRPPPRAAARPARRADRRASTRRCARSCGR